MKKASRCAGLVRGDQVVGRAVKARQAIDCGKRAQVSRRASSTQQQMAHDEPAVARPLLRFPDRPSPGAERLLPEKVAGQVQLHEGGGRLEGPKMSSAGRH